MPESKPARSIRIAGLDTSSSCDGVEQYRREYHSKSLGRAQAYACFLPAGAGQSDARYPLLLLLHGSGGGWQDWFRYTRMLRYLHGRELIVVCPDGGEGWYTNSAAGGERREDDIIVDLLPHLEQSLPLAEWPARAVEGLSMGGYGALKLGLKYPHVFSLAVSHSGALEITGRPQAHPVFGNAEDGGFRRRESLLWLAEQALCRPAGERPRLVFDCGFGDPLLESNRLFSDQLNFIGYGHSFREMPGYHTWPYWDRAFRTALPDVLAALGLPGTEATGGSAAPRPDTACMQPRGRKD